MPLTPDLASVSSWLSWIGGQLQPVIPMLGVLLGASISSRSAMQAAKATAALSRQNYAAERIWDTKKNAYTAITAALRNTAQVARSIDAGYGDDQANPEAFDDSEQHRSMYAVMVDRWNACKVAFDRDHLLLAEPFVAAFEELLLEISVSVDNHEGRPPDVQASDLSRTYLEALANLSELAKRDLHV